MLVHLSPTEVNSLNKISGNTMTINPDTGLPEGKSWLLENGLPMLASIAAGVATGGSSTWVQMAAAAAASGVANKAVGKSDEEAINSALLSGATAGLFGGAGGSALKNVGEDAAIEATKKASQQAGKNAIEQSLSNVIPATMPGNLVNSGANAALVGGQAAGMDAFLNTVPQAAADDILMAETAGRLATDGSVDAFRNNAMKDAFALADKGGLKNTFNSAVAPISDVGETIKFGMSEAGGNRTLTDMLSERAVYTPLAARGTGELAVNAYADKLNKDANKPFYDPLAPENREVTPINTIPFTQTLNQPSYTEEDIFKNFSQGPGMNYFNQAYGQEGGQVLQMKTGGNLGNYIPSVGIIGGLLDSLRSKKKDTSPNITNNYYGTGPDGQPMLMDGPPQQIPLGNPIQMAGGGLSGLQESASDVKNKFFSSPLISPLLKTLGKDPDKFGPKGSSQGGKGKTIRGLVDDVNEQKLQQQKQPTQKMNQGGMTQFNSIMGNPALQLQNPNPPMQMGLGGWVSETLGLGGSGSASAGGPKGSSQGGKGSGNFSEMLNSPEVKAMFQQQGVGVDGSTGTDQFAQLSDNPVQQMAGGGMMGDIPPEMLEMLKSQVSAPAPVKGYDVLADINNNPMQQMNQGGMTGAGQSRASLMQALQPMLQVANQQSQQPVQMARGKRVSTDIVEGLRAIADGAAFEGKVEGAGDGMSDDIPFMIEGEQPALLARDEYVIPADVVAMVGNGSSNAGAEQFDQFLNNIRQTKYGRTEQPRETQGLEALLG
tara:strand:- start:916 stop:3231 length:2316 start_codon:yes stop_codon:yes gene_type:complete